MGESKSPWFLQMSKMRIFFGQGERTALWLTRRANLPRRFKSVSSAIQKTRPKDRVL